MSGIAEDRKREILAQLDRVVSSAAFSGSERHRRFLTFVVEQALKGETDKINEFVLGFEVFNKKESFDPRIDSIVRVEARRLRERLKKYYQEEGRGDPIIVTLRPRSFVPDFQDASPKAAPRAWIPSHKTIAIAVAAMLLGGALTAVLLLRNGPPAPPPTASILVLPFQTLSPAAGQELLGEAIADSIITGLAGSPGLRVIARGSAVQFKESGRSPAQFAADLQVDYIVEGTVVALPDHARVSAKMTDVHSQSYIWAATRETKFDKLADLEREITGAVASHIRIPLPPDSGQRVIRRRSANWQSYAAFLKGQYYWYQQERGATEKSVALFEEATREDPNYAPAWAWLAQGYHLLIMRDSSRDAALIAKGRQAAQKALALDANLAESHAAIGVFATLDWDWPAAEREFRSAVELNPEWALGHMTYSLLYLVPTGQARPALREMLKAHELDPLTRTTRFFLANVLYVNREYARAIAEAEDLRRPGGPSPADRIYYLALSLSGQGKRALEELLKVTSPGEDSPGTAVLGYLLANHGDRNQALAIQQRLLKKGTKDFFWPQSVALVSTALGDRDEAFRQLGRAVEDHVPAVTLAVSDPALDPLRSDPRWAELLQRIGLKAK